MQVLWDAAGCSELPLPRCKLLQVATAALCLTGQLQQHHIVPPCRLHWLRVGAMHTALMLEQNSQPCALSRPLQCNAVCRWLHHWTSRQEGSAVLQYRQLPGAESDCSNICSAPLQRQQCSCAPLQPGAGLLLPRCCSAAAGFEQRGAAAAFELRGLCSGSSRRQERRKRRRAIASQVSLS